MKRTSIIIVLILLLAGGLFYFSGHFKQAQAPLATPAEQANRQDQTGQNQIANSSISQSVPITNTTTPSPGTKKIIQTPAGTTQSTFSAGEGGDLGPDIQVSEIDYDGSQFTPSSLTIKANDYVIFKNKGTTDFWPASNPHPTHTDYPGFDAKKPIAPGGRYQFQFTKAGSWGFHDHLNPSARGTVNVK